MQKVFTLIGYDMIETVPFGWPLHDFVPEFA